MKDGSLNRRESCAAMWVSPYHPLADKRAVVCTVLGPAHAQCPRAQKKNGDAELHPQKVGPQGQLSIFESETIFFSLSPFFNLSIFLSLGPF